MSVKTLQFFNSQQVNLIKYVLLGLMVKRCLQPNKKKKTSLFITVLLCDI